MEFVQFNLHPDLQRGITEAGYLACMPVQEQVLRSAFGGQDLYVQSQTGTGKTAAFLIVIFQRLLSEPLLKGKKAIIMVPTRELAVQVEGEAKTLGKYLPFKTGSFYGGVGYGEQRQMLRDHADILVGTPGRVLDLNKSGEMNLMDIAFLVLDEADRMFDMGFYPDLRKLIKVVPPADRRQTMLFSATLNAYVKNLAWEYTKNPLEIEIAPEKVTVEEIDQLLYHVSSEDKLRLLLGILRREEPESAIIFCNTKRYTEIVARRLEMNGIPCEFIIGDLPQVKRLKIIEDLKAGKIRFLVATDVAARGLDIEGLALVVNYDLPVEAENYVHRIGRTARAGRTGRAITLASEQDVYELADIEKYIGDKIPSQVADASLYGEDKSEGARIRTTLYDDHERGRDSRRPGGRTLGRGPFGADRDRDRRRESGGNGGKEPRRASAPSREASDAGAEKTFRWEWSGQRPMEGPDLSGLSFEERMAYYRQKYDRRGEGFSAPAPAPAPAPSSGRPEKRRPKPRPPAERPAPREEAAPAAAAETPTAEPAVELMEKVEKVEKGEKKNSGGRRRESPKPSGRIAGGKRRRRGGKGRGGAGAGKKPGQEGGSQAAPPEKKAEKKGILGRLLGLFQGEKGGGK